MAIDPDVLKLLQDEGLSQDEISAVESAFNSDKLNKALKEGVMRKTTYIRKVGEVEAERKRLNENWETANAEYLRMQSDVTATQAERDAARKEKDEAAKALKEAQDKLAAQPQFDATKMLTTEEFDKRQREFAAAQTAYFGDVLDIAVEHESLFKTKIKPKELIREALAAGKTPMQFWEEKYQVTAKRDEIAKADAAANEERIRKEEREKVISEMSNPATRILDASKNPFYEPKEQGKSPWDDEGTPDSESKLLQELTNVHRG